MKFYQHAFLTLATSTLVAKTLAHETTSINPASHAPISIMGDHRHKAGEWMVSWRTMQMTMSGLKRGSDDIDEQTLVTEVPNVHGMPPMQRVAPREMTSTMHMLGMMYAPNDDLTLMAMFNWHDKQMTLQSYQGMMGATPLGEFETSSAGLGDTQLGLLYGVNNIGPLDTHLNFSISLPTGSLKEDDVVLTPMNTTPTRRLPYGMQLGSGTVDLKPGITTRYSDGDWAFGGQLMATLRLGTNGEGYRLGNQLNLEAWAQYRLHESTSISLGLNRRQQKAIQGTDSAIALPVITADPANYGGQLALAKIGVNWVGQEGALRGHRLALEWMTPVHEKANGIQMAMDDMLVVGYQFAF